MAQSMSAVERRYYIQWQDPTAEQAIRQCDNDKRRGYFRDFSAAKPDSKTGLAQAEVDIQIYNLKRNLGRGLIDNATYNTRIKHWRRLRRKLGKPK